MLYKEAQNEKEMQQLLKEGYTLANMKTVGGKVTYIMKESKQANSSNMLLG